VRFSDTVKITRVRYHGHIVPKGDTDTNILRVIDPSKVEVIATAIGPKQEEFPYILHSGSFWAVADSPFSYSSENDRYLVFADVLHDILGIRHAEDHRAILRVEDINATSSPKELEATLAVIKRHHIPFTFGFVPTYINPHENVELQLADQPEVVSVLKKYVAAGGVPVLHGYTHQYRGVTTDDYEFWDDLGDRPVRGDSKAFAERRVEEAIRECMNVGLYPVTWETPHYAASRIDYEVFKQHFHTVFERRLVSNYLGSDQYFPYPVIDLYHQYVIPEDLAYIPIEDQKVETLLANASAEALVRDGYATAFFHPFLKPELLEQLLTGIEQRGFHFVDIRQFPNEVVSEGRVIMTQSGAVPIPGHGRYLDETIFGARGQKIRSQTLIIPPNKMYKRLVRLEPDQTYVAQREETPPPNWLQKLVHLAKGDLSVLQHRWETVFTSRPAHDPVRTTLLWDPKAQGPMAVDQQSFYSGLASLGFDIERVDYNRLSNQASGPFALLVVPCAAARAMPAAAVERVVGAVIGGITLITDGESPLSKALGIRLGEPMPVENLTDHLAVNLDTRWPDRPTVPWVARPSAQEADVYYSVDPEAQYPLALSRRLGEGRYLYFAPLFDPLSGRGYARFPNLPQVLFNELRISPMLRRQGADAYFDPGYRQSISIEVLAKMWRQFGIRAVHAAAWHFYDKYTYDYARLVRVAHQNGILVYAWFEWPEVSQRFWDQHPEWREKNAFLADAKVDWRYLMNLQDPGCLKAVLEDAQAFLKAYDWDGVDIGELTFESLEGPDRPDHMTPFNSQARQGFSRQYGFDPVELFQRGSPHFWEDDDAGIQAFYRYRRDVNQDLLRTFLTMLDQLNRRAQGQWEIIVTVLDVLQHPELSDYIGIDLPRTIELLKTYHATLQVEDPSEEWSKAPDRYTRLGQRYQTLGLARPFMIDINVLDNVHPRDQRGFATNHQTGLEVTQLWRAASLQVPRVSFYSESSVYEQDWETLPYAMANESTVHKEGDNWIIQTPHTVLVEVGRGTRRYRLDGQPWFCADPRRGEVWVPPGEHTVNFVRAQTQWFDTSQLQTHLLSLSGELLGSQRVSRGLDVEYISPTRCALMFNKLPYSVSVDGEPSKLTALRGDEGYTVLAPPGQHRLHVTSESVGLYFVEFTSVVLASLIVLFGIASTGLLAILFMFVTLRRRTHKIRRFVGQGVARLKEAMG
jgi:peptidoglycan/xylan/chitin deacetylase (PgdA/CDA1 family)